MSVDRQMRIGLVVPEYASRPPLGGIATYARNTALWLAKHGHDVHVVCVTRTGLHGNEDDAGVLVHFVPPTRIRPRRVLRLIGGFPGLTFLRDVYAGWDLLENSLGAWRVIWALDRNRRFDLIECADFGGLAFWGLLSPLRNRIILRGHGYLNLELEHVNWPGRHFHHFLEGFCLRRARWIVPNSRFLAEAYCRHFDVDESRLYVLYHGFHLPVATGSVQTLRAERGWGASPVVLYVGRLEEQKGTDILFGALAIAKSICPELRAVLLGSVNERFRLAYERFLEQHSDWVWHPGSVSPSEVMEIMRQVDMVVLPSRTETFGRVLVEAQLCGCAVIGMRLGGMPEIVEHEVTGLLVEPEDVVGLANAIVRLCQWPNFRQMLATNGAKRAQEMFGMERVMVQHLELYRKIAAVSNSEHHPR